MKITRPTVSLLKGCEYTPSHRTDIRRTIQRERERLAREATWHAETQQNALDIEVTDKQINDAGREIGMQKADAGLDVETILRLFLTGDGFIAECDIPHIVHALTAQTADDARDAARYRWLRQRWGRVTETYDGDNGRVVEVGTEPAGEGWDIDPETLDAAIDAAMQRTSGGDHG